MGLWDLRDSFSSCIQCLFNFNRLQNRQRICPMFGIYALWRWWFDLPSTSWRYIAHSFGFCSLSLMVVQIWHIGGRSLSEFKTMCCKLQGVLRETLDQDVGGAIAHFFNCLVGPETVPSNSEVTVVSNGKPEKSEANSVSGVFLSYLAYLDTKDTLGVMSTCLLAP